MKRKKSKMTPTADRHLPGTRKPVAFTPGIYALLTFLARRNGRPLNWEVNKYMAVEHLRRAGLWPPPDELLQRLEIWPPPADIADLLAHPPTDADD